MDNWIETDNDLMQELKLTLRRFRACKVLKRQGRDLAGCTQRHRDSAEALKKALESRGWSVRVGKDVITLDDPERGETVTLPS